MSRKSLMPQIVLGLVLLALAGCGGPPPASQQPIEDRILARWQHMIDRDFDSAWEFYTPGFRQLNPRETFSVEMSARPVRWHAAELLDVECEQDRCIASLRVTVQPTAGPATLRHLHIPSETEETWLLLDGVWWFSEN
jgi:hypothetical protein